MVKLLVKTLTWNENTQKSCKYDKRVANHFKSISDIICLPLTTVAPRLYDLYD